MDLTSWPAASRLSMGTVFRRLLRGMVRWVGAVVVTVPTAVPLLLMVEGRRVRGLADRVAEVRGEDTRDGDVLEDEDEVTPVAKVDGSKVSPFASSRL